MPAYSFKTWKAAKVESGESRQTIRPVRKRPTRPGDTLYLYHGQRTKSARLLRVEKCLSVATIRFETPVDVLLISVNGRYLQICEVLKLMEDDGFDDFDQFYQFFQKHYGFPNKRPLELIKW